MYISLSLSIHIYIYIHIHVYVYIYIYIHTYTYTYIYSEFSPPESGGAIAGGPTVGMFYDTIRTLREIRNYN